MSQAPEAANNQGASPPPVVQGPAAIHHLIDRLATRFAEGDFREEASRAKEEFFERAGKVFDDDAELFEARVAAFLEWYVLERPLDGSIPPVLRMLEDPDVTAEDRRLLGFLATSHHSLFDVSAVSDHAVDLEDLLGGARFRVVERRSTIGFEPDQIVEARLVFDGSDVVFGKTFLFHPAEAREEVVTQIDAALESGLSRAEVMHHLSRLHLRWFRSGSVPAAKIYGSDRLAITPGAAGS